MKSMLRCELYVAETDTHIRQLAIKLPANAIGRYGCQFIISLCYGGSSPL